MKRETPPKPPCKESEDQPPFRYQHSSRPIIMPVYPTNVWDFATTLSRKGQSTLAVVMVVLLRALPVPGTILVLCLAILKTYLSMK
jgi:hypothetical protein